MCASGCVWWIAKYTKRRILIIWMKVHLNVPESLLFNNLRARIPWHLLYFSPKLLKNLSFLTGLILFRCFFQFNHSTYSKLQLWSFSMLLVKWRFKGCVQEIVNKFCHFNVIFIFVILSPFNYLPYLHFNQGSSYFYAGPQHLNILYSMNFLE